MKLKNKIAIVTGGSKGIGKSISMKLASEGATVIIHYCEDLDQATATMGQIRELKGISYAVRADFSNPKEAEFFFEKKIDPITKKINKGTNGFDILVNNAGVFQYGDLQDINSEDFDHLFNVNAKPVLLLMKNALTRINHSGRIVNISSGASIQADSKSILYGLSKSVVDNMTLALTAAFGLKEVTVNALAPGPVETTMVREFSTEIVKKIIGKKTALKRIGCPEDIAEVVSFLVSKEGGWINGTRIEVNGGYNKY